MDSLITFLNTTGKTFVDFSIPMLIQSSVLIIVLLVLDLLLRKKVQAIFRYCIWLLVLVKLVLPTTLSSPTGLGYWFGDKFDFAKTELTEPVNQVAVSHKKIMHEIPAESALSNKLDAAGNEIKGAEWPRQFIEAELNPALKNNIAAASPVTVSLSWQGFAFLGWLAAVIAMVLLLIQRMFFVRGLLAQSIDPSDSMIGAFQQCQQQMKIRGKVNLKLSPVAASPSVCGLVRPTILIPQNLPSKLTREDLRSILLHELAHIKRGDLWVSLVQTILQIAYFYNPLLWAANAIIRKIREPAVDVMVLVAMGEQAEDYPETLLNISRLTFSRPVLSLRLIGVVESKKALSGRIKHILSRPFPKTAKLGFVGLIAVIIAASILLPMAKAASKPPEFIIRGTVTDSETGQPIAGAKVGDVEKYANGKQWTTTDSNGHYEYKTWYEEHGVKAKADGYKRQDKGFGTKLFGSEKEKIIDFALTPGKGTEQSEFKATLPNGVTVELISVCKARDNQRCWVPDGSLFSKAPYYKSGVWAGSEAFEFAFRVKNLDEEQSATSWKIDGKYATGSGNREHPTDEAGKEIADIWVIDAKIIEGVQKCDISFGVAASPWQTQAKCVGIQGMVTSEAQHPYTFAQAYVHNDMVCVTVSDVMVKLAKRLIAIDNNGNTHLSELVRTGSTKGLRQSTFGFKNLKLEDIKEFQFQTQPYEWTEFKNVSLKPDFKTNVQIEIERGKQYEGVELKNKWERWEEQMHRWSETFGEKYGKEMEDWGEEFGEQWEQWGEQMEEWVRQMQEWQEERTPSVPVMPQMPVMPKTPIMPPMPQLPIIDMNMAIDLNAFKADPLVIKEQAIETTKRNLIKKLQILDEQRLRIERDLVIAERAMDDVRDRFGIIDLEERSYPHPITARLTRLQEERDNCVLEISQLGAKIENLQRQKADNLNADTKELQKAEADLIVLQRKCKELDKMVEEAKAEKRDLDIARYQYQKRVSIRDERREMLNSIKSQIEKLRIMHEEAGSSILEKDPKAAKTLKIIVYEGGKEPEITLNIPLTALKIANGLLPPKIKAQMLTQGINLEEILKQVDEGLEPTTLLDVKDGAEHVIISLE